MAPYPFALLDAWGRAKFPSRVVSDAVWPWHGSAGPELVRRALAYEPAMSS
jgi:hypothetical protein